VAWAIFMTATRLSTIAVEKPWGRTQLGFGFDDVPAGGAPIGEIWFDAPRGTDPDLMVKYLFTSERLSIQVHPDDRAAKARGHKRGKDEAWVVLAAEPGATIALGTVRPVSREELRIAALDGSIETLMNWQPVKAGDVIYSPAGTVHAIGAGLTILEIQQNVDLTYRLYDYGRPRELHLDDGIAVSHPVPFEIVQPQKGRDLPVYWDLEGDKFDLMRFEVSHDVVGVIGPDAAWFIPLSGEGKICGEAFRSGECWMITGEFSIEDCAGSDFIIAKSNPAA
jgi:mannose-6-phosphate isomerase